MSKDKKTKQVIGALYADIKENALANILLKDVPEDAIKTFLTELYKDLAAVSEIDDKKGLVLKQDAQENIRKVINGLEKSYTEEKTTNPPNDRNNETRELKIIRTKYNLYTLGLDYIENHNKSANELKEKAKGFAGDSFIPLKYTRENNESDGFLIDGGYRENYLSWKKNMNLLGNFVQKSLADITGMFAAQIREKVESAKDTPSVTTTNDNDLYNRTLEILKKINNSDLNAANNDDFIELKANYQKMNSNANQYPETKNLFEKLTKIVNIEKLNNSNNITNTYLFTSSTTAIKHNFSFITSIDGAYSTNTTNTPGQTPKTPTQNISPTLS
jgi:hypothetical protein